MIFCRPIRSAGVLSLLVAAAVGLTAEPVDARPKKRAPTRTAKQVAPPKLVQVPLPRPSPLRQPALAAADILVPLPRANPRTVEPEPTAPSLRLFAPNSPPPLAPASDALAFCKGCRLLQAAAPGGADGRAGGAAFERPR